MTSRAVVYSGGPTHDFPALTAHLRGVLQAQDVEVTATEDFAEATAMLPDADLLVVNALRWQMRAERYAQLRAALAFSPSEASRTAVAAHLGRGGALLALHTAVICFDDWPEWRDLVGGRWDWSRSSHPPSGPARVAVHADRHPIVEGLPQHFDTDDEVYGFLDLAPDVEPLLTGSHSGVTHPLMWARRVGTGRVVTSTLGHHLPSYEPPEYQQIVDRSIAWLLDRLPGGQPS